MAHGNREHRDLKFGELGLPPRAEQRGQRTQLPYTERASGDGGDKLYFIDRTGERWRVYDVAFGPPLLPPGRLRGFPPPDRRASSRYFVHRDGTRRAHRFERGEDRAPTSEHLARQLAGAGYVARTRFDPDTIQPWKPPTD